MTDVEARVNVRRDVAETFPSRPDRVAEAKAAAERAMQDVARERGRRVSSEPHLVDIDSHPLSPDLVELRFQARTQPA